MSRVTSAGFEYPVRFWFALFVLCRKLFMVNGLHNKTNNISLWLHLKRATSWYVDTTSFPMCVGLHFKKVAVVIKDSV